MKHILVVFIMVPFVLSVNLANAQTAAADNKLSQTITYHPIPKGPTVFGVFEGRSPCYAVAKQLKIATDADFPKLKWHLALYRDSVTFQPTTYALSFVGGGDIIQQKGGSYRYKLIEGKWSIIKGTPSNPDAEVFRLEMGKHGDYFYFLKADENILFILDEKKAFRVGNANFSYTLNRVELVPGK